MNVAKHDILTLGLHAILGSLVGVVWGSLSLYSSRRVGSGLRVHSLLLPRDNTLQSIAAEMERMGADSLVFSRCINTTDQLLHLRFSLSDGVLKPAEGQEQEANELICLIRDDLKQLRDLFVLTHVQSPKESEDFSSLVTQFSERLDLQHVVYITRRTIRFRK